jgi:hypothetical protein
MSVERWHAQKVDAAGVRWAKRFKPEGGEILNGEYLGVSS